jgi:3-methylornithyl-N6-L-lysine dehydrogenase
MTRLVAGQISLIPETMEDYEQQLNKKTGCGLKKLAIDAAGPGAANINPAIYRVTVIPVTAGLGAIEGFTEAIRAIAVHLGFNASVTASTDVAGLVEAYQSKADLIILADDHVYAAINLKTGRVAGNDEATAKGYTTALKMMAGSLQGKEVLLIGTGSLGAEAAKALLQEGARLILHDLVRVKEAALAGSFEQDLRQRIVTGLSLQEAFSRKPLIYDASPGEAFIKAEWLDSKAIMVAPGLPLGLDAEALMKMEQGLVHDPLQIGTAVMLLRALL